MIQLRSGQITAWIISLSLAGYPMIAGLATALDLPSTQFSIALRSTVLGLSLVVILHNILKLRRPTRLSVFVALLLIFYGLRLIYETTFDSTSLGLAPSQYWVWYLGVTSLPALAVLLTQNLDFVLLRRVLVGTLTAAAVLIAYTGTDEAVSGGELLNTGRIALEALNPISVGNVGAYLGLISLWEIFGNREAKTRHKFFWGLTLGLGLYLVIVSASRGPLIALGAATVVMGLSLPTRYKIWFLIGAPALLVPTTLYSLTLASSLNISFLSRLFELGTASDISSTIRGDLYATAFSLIKEYPLLGSSIEIEAYASYPHNFFLEYFMATGVFAGAFAIYVMGSLLLRATRLINLGQASAVMGLLFISTFVGAQFSAAVYSNGPIWVLAAAVAASTVERAVATRRTRLTYRASSARVT